MPEIEFPQSILEWLVTGFGFGIIAMSICFAIKACKFSFTIFCVLQSRKERFRKRGERARPLLTATVFFTAFVGISGILASIGLSVIGLSPTPWWAPLPLAAGLVAAFWLSIIVWTNCVNTIAKNIQNRES